MAAGDSHTCGVRTDGAVECWGSNSHGQIDAPEGAFTAVSTGVHSCGLRPDGAVECWGTDEAPAAGAFAAVEVGQGYTCGLRPDGAVECWGTLRAPPEGVTYTN